MNIYCYSCNKTKNSKDFYFSKRLRKPCKDCGLEKRRSMHGVVSQRWNGILGRTHRKGSHFTTAFGKDRCSKQEFFEWATNNPKFKRLYDNWKRNNFNNKWSPSIDRIQTDKGYTLDNIQWLRMDINNAKGNFDTPRNHGEKKVLLTKGKEKMTFNSGKEASLYFGKNRLAVTNNIKCGHKLQGWTCSWLQSKE